MGPAIRLTGVGKRYPTHRGTGSGSLKGALVGGLRELRRREWHWALRDVDLVVEPGRAIGLIGPNGAGKSTLLRLVGGVGRPTTGSVEVEGRVGALLELGTGFHPDLTGREGAVLAMVIAGATRREAVARLPEVTAFSGLDGYVDAPLRTYSTGMAARLAFAVATSAEPELLLVDEVLAVGDLAFQRRCLQRIEEHRAAGATLVLVSHDPSLVAATCDEAVWLQGGTVVAHGPARDVLDGYVAANEEATRAATPEDATVTRTAAGSMLVPGDNRLGDQAARIDAVRLLDGWGALTDTIGVGAGLVVDVSLDGIAAVAPAHVGVRIVRASDRAACVDSSTLVGSDDDAVRLSIERLDLAPGIYDVEVGLYDTTWATTHDHHRRAYPLRVTGEGPHGAVLAPPLTWDRPGGVG